MGEGGSRTYLTLAGSPRPDKGKLVDMICTKHKPFTVSSDSAGARPILQHALEIIQRVNSLGLWPNGMLDTGKLTY